MPSKDPHHLRTFEFEYLQLFVASAIVESQEPGAVLQPAVYVNSDSSGFYVFYATEGGQDMVRLVV